MSKEPRPLPDVIPDSTQSPNPPPKQNESREEQALRLMKKETLYNTRMASFFFDEEKPDVASDYQRAAKLYAIAHGAIEELIARKNQ